MAGGVAFLVSLATGAKPDDVVPAAITLLVFGLINLAINWKGRNQVPATIRLLRMSADCMAANPALVRVAAALGVASLAAVAPLVWFFGGCEHLPAVVWHSPAAWKARPVLPMLPWPLPLPSPMALQASCCLLCSHPHSALMPPNGAVASLRSGSLVANPARGGRAECVNSHGLPVPCCDFMPDGWAIAYALIPLPFLILWTLAVAAQARGFVIGGAVAQW